MFEKVNSIASQADERSGVGASGDSDAASRDRFHDQAASERGGDALRAIDWGELNARLGAARDLRELLRRDAQLNIEANDASFGDAAARYFAALESGERPVNPDDLEARKASRGILGNSQGDAARGDARDDR